MERLIFLWEMILHESKKATGNGREVLLVDGGGPGGQLEEMDRWCGVRKGTIGKIGMF